MKKIILIIVAMMCVSMTHAHELSTFEIGAIIPPSSDSVTIISEESKDYSWDRVGTWHYLLVNYSDGTSKIFDQNNNWVHFETEYEIDLITDERTDKPLKLDVYWKSNSVKNVIAAEISDEYGKMNVKTGVVEYLTPYNLSISFMLNTNESFSNSIKNVFIWNGSRDTSVLREFSKLSELSDNHITVKGPNGNTLSEMKVPYERILSYSRWYSGNGYDGYYDKTTRKTYRIDVRGVVKVDQACSITSQNTEVYNITDDVVFVPCIPTDTITRFVFTDKVCEIYYSNGDYIKYTKQSIEQYSLVNDQIFDCIIHRPDGILTVKLEDIPSNEAISGKEKRPIIRYEFTNGKYSGLTNVAKFERLTYKDVLGVTQIITPRKGSFYSFIDPKTNHVLTITDNEGVLYDNTLKQYVTLDGKVKDFEKEAREKIEKERQSLYQKYGKQYVDALLDQGKILVGTPEGLVKNHTQSTLINETQYTRTYKIRGWLSDWAATVDVNAKTGKVTAVRNRTL